jgi:integrase
MKRLLKKASIKKHATPHIFRHTHISMLAEAEVDITTIMDVCANNPENLYACNQQNEKECY